MFEVLVFSGNVKVDSCTFFSENAAISWASEMQDNGFTVRIFH